MDHKKLQKKRMMSYFIDAAKEIIKTEGVKNLTVRKVGEKAGYSYATIYNYFSDLNTLLFYCVMEFLEDCYVHMIKFKNDEVDCREQIIIYAVEYFTFFLENPDLFYLIFVEDLRRVSETVIEYTTPSVDLLLTQNLLKCAERGYIQKDNIEILGNLITNHINGKLLFALRINKKESLEDILMILRSEIKFILK